MTPGLRTYLLFLGAGLVASLVATILLRTGEGAKEMGWLVLCTIETVPPPEFPAVLLTFAVEPLLVFFIAALGVAYLMVFITVRRGSSRRLATTGRLISFYVGLGLVFFIIFGPVAAYSRTFLTAHMIQHFVLITIAPPLILAGAPLTLLLIATPAKRRNNWLYPILHNSWFHRFTNPLVGLVLFGVIPLGWFLTPAFRESLTNPLIHHLGYGLFLFAGIHYWWPVVGGNPSRWNLPHPVRVMYLFALVPIHAFLGLYFYEPSHVMFEELQALPRTWGPSPLFDQQIAGAMMFIVGEMVGLVAVVVAAFRWAAADDREAKRGDAARRRERALAQSGE